MEKKGEVYESIFNSNKTFITNAKTNYLKTNGIKFVIQRINIQ